MTTAFLLRTGDRLPVCHEPAHPHPGRPDWTAGHGRCESVTLVGPGGWPTGGLLLALHASRLAPGASIGWHEHRDDEELYVVTAGDIELRLCSPQGEEHRLTLGPGDAHRLPRGGAHAARAGPRGAGLLVAIWRPD